MTLIQEFQDLLKTLERERWRALRDGQGARLASTIVLLITLLFALVAPFSRFGWLGEWAFCVTLYFVITAPWQTKIGREYRDHFRTGLIPQWFQRLLPGKYLIRGNDQRAIDNEQFDVELSRSRCLPWGHRTRIREKILFDRDPYYSTILVVDVGVGQSAMQALVWHQPRVQNEDGLHVCIKDRAWLKSENLAAAAVTLFAVSSVRLFSALLAKLRNRAAFWDGSRLGVLIYLGALGLGFAFAMYASLQGRKSAGEFPLRDRPLRLGLGDEDAKLLGQLDVGVFPRGTSVMPELEAGLEVFRTAKRISGGDKVSVCMNNEGVWVAVLLKQGLFPAPTVTSCLDEKSYLEWKTQGALIASNEIRQLMARLTR